MDTSRSKGVDLEDLVGRTSEKPKRTRGSILRRAVNQLPGITAGCSNTDTNPKTQQVRDIKFAGPIHNNKMERMNGEVSDREKTFRGLKRTDTPILKGY